jgi:hypothetical protein
MYVVIPAKAGIKKKTEFSRIKYGAGSSSVEYRIDSLYTSPPPSLPGRGTKGEVSCRIWYNDSVNFDREKIKSFVQHTLGCGCPEEVFNIIDCQFNIKLNDEAILSNKIKIGNRLLIYVLEVNNTGPVKNILPFLIKSGKTERDNLKFNRFRLVLITDRVDGIKKTAESIFYTINKDDKVHLHIVEKDVVPIFFKT